MEKKQNCIDWLEEQYYESEGKLSRQDFEQVKAMHKEEVIESYREGRSDQQSKEKFYHRNSEQYYNETFGGSNSEIPNLS